MTDLPRMLNRLAFALAAMVLVIRPLYVHEPGRVGPSLVMALVAGAAVLLRLAAKALRRDAIQPRREWQTTAALALMGLAVVIALFTAAHRRPAIGLACEWIATLLAVFCLLETARDERPLAGVLAAMLLATAVVVALYGLHQYLFGLAQLRAEYARNPAVLLRRLGIEYGTWMQARFEKRLANNEAFSTFAVANSLAGYLVMLVPVALGLLADQWRRRRRPWLALAALAGTAVVMLAVLPLTKSRGGLVVGLAALAAFGIGAAWPRLRRYRRGLAAGGLAALLLVAGAVAWRIHARGVEGALGPSMRFRVDYWTGAVRMIARHPVGGVGLAAFGDYYTRYKLPESPEDVRDPHNLVFGLWSEMGLLGLAAFTWLCGVFAVRSSKFEVRSSKTGLRTSNSELRTSARRARIPPGTLDRHEAGLDPAFIPVLVALPLWVVVYFVGLASATFCALGGALWIALSVAMTYRRHRAGAGESTGSPRYDGAEGLVLGRLTQAGLAAGALAFLLHAMIDLDVSVPALVATVLGLMVLRRQPSAVSGQRSAVKGTVPGTIPLPSTHSPLRSVLASGLLPLAAFAVIALWFAYGVAQPMLAGEALFDQAQAAQIESEDAARAQDYATAGARYTRALWCYAQSLKSDPLLDNAHFALAQAAFNAWRARRGQRSVVSGQPGRTPERDPKDFQAGLDHLHAAQRLHPRRAQAWALETQVDSEAARLAPSPTERRAFLEDARRAADFLVDELYPTNVPYRLLRAHVREALDDRPGALADYRAALAYDALQRDPLLRLPPPRRKDIEDALKRLAP